MGMKMLINNFPVLSFLIWFPIISGFLFLSFFVKLQYNRQFLQICVSISSGICLIISCFIFYYFDSKISSLQNIEYREWIPTLGINYFLGIDGFSLLFVILTCLMTFLVIIYSFNSIKEKVVLYFSCFLIMQGLMCGVFLSIDSILFYIFFEAMLIPMFLLIGIWGSTNRIYATLKFFLYTFFGSVFLLISIIYLHYISIKEGYLLSESFSIFTFQNLFLTFYQQKWLFFALLLAFAIKIPMWPMHTWLPDAHVEAPTGGSVILAAITLKIGGYGMLRLLLPIVPDACSFYSKFVILLSIVAIIYIGFVAIVQSNMKKMVAYSSISHMGFVTLGLFLIFQLPRHMTNSEFLYDGIMSVQGSMFQMISHGFIAGALFFCVGVLYERLHTKEIFDFGGVANVMPIFSIFFLIFALSNTGLPGTSGFVGEFFIILITYKVSFWLSFCTATTLILSASYTLWLYKRVMFGSLKNELILTLSDLSIYEKFIFVILSGLVLFFGIYPEPLIVVMDYSIENLIYHIFKFRVFTE